MVVYSLYNLFLSTHIIVFIDYIILNDIIMYCGIPLY